MGEQWDEPPPSPPPLNGDSTLDFRLIEVGCCGGRPQHRRVHGGPLSIGNRPPVGLTVQLQERFPLHLRHAVRLAPWQFPDELRCALLLPRLGLLSLLGVKITHDVVKLRHLSCGGVVVWWCDPKVY